MTTLNIGDILKIRDFPTGGRRVVLARHSLNRERKNYPKSVSSRMVAFLSHSAKNFEWWQRVQGRNGREGKLLIGCDYVVAFCSVKDAKMNARFVGVFRNFNNSPEPLNIDRDLPSALASIYHGKEQAEIEKNGSPKERVFLNLVRDPLFADLEGRVVVDWYGHHNHWVQEFSPNGYPDGYNYQVLEITRKVYVPFEEWR